MDIHLDDKESSFLAGILERSLEGTPQASNLGAILADLHADPDLIHGILVKLRATAAIGM